MVDSVSANQLSRRYVLTEPTFPVSDVAMIPGLLPIFLHSCGSKSGSGLGTRLVSHGQTQPLWVGTAHTRPPTMLGQLCSLTGLQGRA